MSDVLKTVLLMGLFYAFPASADTVYRSVDAEGNVVFSDRPPVQGAPAETVQLPQGPSEESIERAQERLRETEARADELTRQRHERDRLRLESRPPAIVYPNPPTAPTYGYPVYRRPRPGLPPHHRPWPHPRPPRDDDDHPAYWPPVLPPARPVRPTPLPSPAPGGTWGKVHRAAP